jgi:hypothetical protein
MKNIEELNPNWSSEFVCIGIIYDEDQCNSIELQGIELLGVCMRVCVVCCVCVLWTYVCNNEF